MRYFLIASLLLNGGAFGAQRPIIGAGSLKNPLSGVSNNKPLSLPIDISTPAFEGIEDKPINVGILPSLPYVLPGGALGHWGVGNGGDALRIGFARARDYAANVVLRINTNSLTNIKEQVIRDWIIKNQKFLAADILQSEHIWTTEVKPTCAWTVQPGGVEHLPVSNPVQFSYPACRENADSFVKTAQILIHESVHHFNGDETTADKVAIGIIDAWQAGNMDAVPVTTSNAPQGTQKHAAVWTGSAVIVVGGYSDENQTGVATVSGFDPRANSWKTYKAPQSFGVRHDALAVWTGKEVLIWGGFRKTGNSTEWVYDGALFNPTTGEWRLLAKPSWWTQKASTWDGDPRQSIVWTGDKAIIWGGIDTNNLPLGGSFNPETLSWSKINNSSEYAPKRIAGHSAIWTGDKMVVWGGYQGISDSSRTITNEGGIYDPKDDSWTPTAIENAPAARAGHQAIWTGAKMVIISGGGVSSRTDLKSTGGQYDFETQSWTNYTSELMVERVGHKAIWNGEEILVVGGRSNRLKTYFGEVYAYNPVTQRWRILSSSTTPNGRYNASIVWTGSSAVVWGGQSDDQKSEKSGGIYYP
jgi:N-acetylneuraminic acid mutarotase